MQKTQRELVATHFEATVPRWEQYYASHSSQSVYATIYRSRLAVALSLADGLRLPRGSRCLDVGCGPGLATVALAQCGFIVNAIDLIKAQLDRTQQHAAEARLAGSASSRASATYTTSIFQRASLTSSL